MKRVHVFISGKVQGVFFRVWTFRYAQKLKLAGWVRNLPDGRVEILVEGSRRKIDKFLKLVSTGPGLSEIEHIETEWGEPKGLENFKIER
jgi:acylphosphatase